MSPDPELSLQKGAYTTDRGSVLWNKISTEIRKLPSLNVFKTSIHGKDFSNTPWLIVTLIIHNVSFCIFKHDSKEDHVKWYDFVYK